MAIEVEEKRLLKYELSSILDEMFSSTEEFSENQMDFSHYEGVLYVNGKEKKIPFFKFKTHKDRESIRVDFSEFLKNMKINESTDGEKFVFSTIFLGMSDGRSRSFYVSDFKIIKELVRKYSNENNCIALITTHFAEKTSNMGNIVEHIHILYNPKNVYSYMGNYLEENYDND